MPKSKPKTDPIKKGTIKKFSDGVKMRYMGNGVWAEILFAKNRNKLKTKKA
jgi:hypothetical protein